MQRGSVDIDLIGSISKEELEKIIRQVEKRLDNVKFEIYKPANPNPNIPLVTYTVKVPRIVEADGTRPLEIKIDFLQEDIILPNCTLTNIETFPAVIKSIKCYTPTSLIGDKLLTLANKTIGIQNEEDVPKQIYDVTKLCEYKLRSAKDFDSIVKVIEDIVPLEAKYRELETSVTEVLKDIEITMDKYSLIDTSGAESQTKQSVEAFAQFYLNKTQSRRLYDWSVYALRIRFLVQLLIKVINKEIKTDDAAKIYHKAITISAILEKIVGSDINKVRGELLSLAEIKIPYFTQLKGKPLHRVFWQIISINNLDKIKY